MLIVVHEDGFSIREIARHGEPDKHNNPYPQRPYHDVIRKREIKQRKTTMITRVRGARKD